MIPAKVVTEARRAWGAHPLARHHSAKQIACWAAAGPLSHDLNAQTDAAIYLGMVAATASDFEAFIDAADARAFWP